MKQQVSKSDKVWVVDDAPSTRFRIYTRANVGEVFPDVVSPLSWSAYGTEAELGWREAWKDYGVLLDRELGIPAVVSATGATTVIPDGADLQVDGTAGTVRILG